MIRGAGPERYPFYARARDELKLPGGRPLAELTLEAVRAGEIAPEEIGIRPETLRAQAVAAEASGFRALALNLRRAAELASLPDRRVLEIYDALRPGRAAPALLEAIARELESASRAPLTAALVREAAAGRSAR